MGFFAFRRMAISQALLYSGATSRSGLISIFIAVLSMLVFGWLFKPGATAFNLGIVDEDGTQASAQSRSRSTASIR